MNLISNETRTDPFKTATHFDRLVEPLLAEIINLAKRIQNLSRTRDLLLPRLVSGQVNLKSN